MMGAAAVVWSALTLVTAVGAAPMQKTTNDGVYSKAQADGAKAPFEKICAECHAFTEAALKNPADKPLGSESFIKKWEGRSLEELVTLIVTTMPDDGSAVVNDDEALNIVAYILQQNGFAAGAAPLTKDGASAVFAKPAKGDLR
jgi:mono/diheme cytochrome c family protein